MVKIPIFALWTSSLPFYRKWEIILLILFVHTHRLCKSQETLTKSSIHTAQILVGEIAFSTMEVLSTLLSNKNRQPSRPKFRPQHHSTKSALPPEKVLACSPPPSSPAAQKSSPNDPFSQFPSQRWFPAKAFV